MPMPAVRAKDRILDPQVGTHSHGDGFLAYVSMTGPVDQAALVGPGELFLAAANEEHLPVKARESLLGERGRHVIGDENFQAIHQDGLRLSIDTKYGFDFLPKHQSNISWL
jgi:hypothetical protein